MYLFRPFFPSSTEVFLFLKKDVTYLVFEPSFIIIICEKVNQFVKWVVHTVFC
jgi:hypothetical protein